MRRLLIAVSLAIVLSLAACSTPFLVAEVMNSRSLREFELTVYEYPLPPSSEVIGRSSDIGLLRGNGNHCDVLVVLTLRTSLAASDVERYYRAPSLLTPLESIRGGRWVLVTAKPTANPQAGGVGEVQVELFSSGDVFQGMEGFDLRCH